MIYSLEYKPKALKEWNKLDNSLKIQFYKKLKERLENPKVPKDKLSGYETFGYKTEPSVADASSVKYVTS